jgi:hypothetical protein
MHSHKIEIITDHEQTDVGRRTTVEKVLNSHDYRLPGRLRLLAITVSDRWGNGWCKARIVS